MVRNNASVELNIEKTNVEEATTTQGNNTVPSKNKNKKDSKKKKSKKDSPEMIKKTAQQSVPYLRVYENGIIESDKGVYSKSYELQDINFQIANEDEQTQIYLQYSDLLNLFGPEVGIQININNRNIDIEQFKESVMLKAQKDDLNYLRDEYNQMLLDKMQEGRNNMRREKYLTISVKADSIDSAISSFARYDTEISTTLKKIVKVDTPPMDVRQRLSILHDIYNIDKEDIFYKKAQIDKQDVQAFTFDQLRKLGITTKDLVAPESIEFKKDYMIIGDKYARVMFLNNLPNFLNTNIIPELTDVACNLLASVHYEPIAQTQGLKIIKNQIVNINANVIDAQKKATKAGYSADLISPDLMRAQAEAQNILNDMTKRNQKLFLTTILITHFADSLDELNKDSEAINTVAQKYLCTMTKLNYQQELGFASCLPLATNRIFVKRMLTTESASVFIPFAAQELTQKNGMYYGLNAVSKNMILFSRLNSKNGNGCILGTPGSGKSFSAKREIINVLLNTNDEVFIIDPEREYAPLTALLGGECVRIAAGSKNYLNPLDMDLDYADDDDPVTLKSDFISSLCETIIGGRYGISPNQKTVIDRCVRQVYAPYLEHMSTLGNDVTYDPEYMPTLIDLYELLLSQPEPEAQNIALSLELYCTGSLDTFAHKTNVNTHSRFVVYDIKDIGSGMKEMGFQICLDTVWNKMISNKKAGKRTWLYLDEFYLLTQTDSSAKFLQQIWKRARKWNGIPTGITQNVEDMLKSSESRTIISNCEFVLMLNQAPLDKIELSQMFNISPTQQQYITNSDSGTGLLYTGKTIVPFVDKFPKDTQLYKVMTTKPDEVDMSQFDRK